MQFMPICHLLVAQQSFNFSFSDFSELSLVRCSKSNPLLIPQRMYCLAVWLTKTEAPSIVLSYSPAPPRAHGHCRLSLTCKANTPAKVLNYSVPRPSPALSSVYLQHTTLCYPIPAHLGKRSGREEGKINTVDIL